MKGKLSLTLDYPGPVFKQRQRVDRVAAHVPAAHPDLEVQVGAGRLAGGADLADRARRGARELAHEDLNRARAQVHEDEVVVLAVAVDHHVVAGAVALVVHRLDDARGAVTGPASRPPRPDPDPGGGGPCAWRRSERPCHPSRRRRRAGSGGGRPSPRSSVRAAACAWAARGRSRRHRCRREPPAPETPPALPLPRRVPPWQAAP